MGDSSDVRKLIMSASAMMAAHGPSISELNNGRSLPSLLMQAARSAAVADGLVPTEQRAPTPDIQSEALKLANNGSSSAASQSNGAPPNPSEDDSSANEAAAAALAMVAARNNNRPRVTEKQQAMELARNAILNASEKKKEKAPSRPSSARAPSPAGVATLADAALVAAKSGSSPAGGGGKKKGPPLRRGKWTVEEEAYANRLIQEFKAGLLPLTDGTTLRTFLSKLLNCDPMRISKKFVGSNCIGKQVFRRRTADINRLTPEQIQQSRAELSELERRFLERVAQTNRVKSNSGVGTSSSAASKVKEEPEVEIEESPPSPPWLRAPNSLKASVAAGGLGQGVSAATTNNRAAAAGRALLQGGGGSSSSSSAAKSLLERKSSKPTLASSTSHGSAGLLAMAEMHRRQSQQSLLNNIASSLTANNSASNLLNAAFAGSSGAQSGSSGLSGPAMAQIARNASAARIAGLAASGHSMNNLLHKTGLSRDQLSQLARDQTLASSHSLSNMMERQSSFDALMSLDFQSLQSIDNLANLIQLGGGIQGQNVPRSGLKNWSNVDAAAAAASGSSGNLAGLANARRLASENRMESLIRTLSSGNVGSRGLGSGSSVGGGTSGGGGGSNANFVNLLQNMQNMNSGNSLFGSGSQLSAANAMSLANLLRVDSSTGLTALRMQDGLVQRNSSVDDFLSLVASGDIPHQDPNLLNVSLQSMLQQQQQAAQQAAQCGNGNASSAQAAANYLAHQQLLAQAANKGNNSISSAMRLSNSAASLLNQYANSQGSAAATNAAAAAFAQQQQQARAAQMNMSASALAAARAAQMNMSASALAERRAQQQNGAGGLKRKFGSDNGQSKR